MNDHIDTILKEATDITYSAGKVIMTFYQDAFLVADKSPDNPVTEADQAADNLLKLGLISLLPEAGWLSEETADSPDRLGGKYCWIVDPLDGTKEFVMGIPEFTVSVALVFDGQPIIGIILNPATGDLYSARRRNGPFLNGRQITVSEQNQLTATRVDASRSELKRGEFDPFKNLVRLQTMGSIAYKLARLSAGQSDATWSRGPKSEWDICAGMLLIEEAGGKIVDLDNRPFSFNQSVPKVNGIIATNGRLQDQVVTMLIPHRDTARTDYRA
jgi:myo-inositol-1(or 4)-monophosphatase